jgi:hypothetical protein
MTLLTRKDLARMFQVKPWTIDSWCRKGILPFEVYPCGKRFDPDKIAVFRAKRSFGSSTIHTIQDKGVAGVGQSKNVYE